MRLLFILILEVRLICFGLGRFELMCLVLGMLAKEGL